MAWMMLWMLLFWAAVVGGAIWLFSSVQRKARDDAHEVLRRRLASGEIDSDEFRRREEALGDGGVARRTWIVGLVVLVIGALIIVPVAAMAAGGWDMDMGMGRGKNTSNDAVVRVDGDAKVSIRGFSFSPGNLEIPVGATVTWTDEDSSTHDATARDDAWSTDRLSEGESDTLTFDAPGEYEYYCSIHPSMKARLVVR